MRVLGRSAFSPPHRRMYAPGLEQFDQQATKVPQFAARQNVEERRIIAIGYYRETGRKCVTPVGKTQFDGSSILRIAFSDDKSLRLQSINEARDSARIDVDEFGKLKRRCSVTFVERDDDIPLRHGGPLFGQL